jgi:cytochrome c biogenesis protein CcdA
MGLLFGLDVSACIVPLLLALLAETVLIGDWVGGTVALFLFGMALSLPALAVIFVEGANRRLQEVSRRYRSVFYYVAGGLLILFGTAEFLLTVLYT